jgi:hypothetical protein
MRDQRIAASRRDDPGRTGTRRKERPDDSLATKCPFDGMFARHDDSTLPLSIKAGTLC